MNLFIIAVLGLSITAAYGSQCVQLSGKWRNELGSTMVLHDLPNSEFTGWYRTGVVSSPGAASAVSNITGASMPVKDGSLLAFTVLFNNGLSLTTWVGQCIVCDGKETIFTTYVYRRHSSKSANEWASTAINQNTFRRIQDSDTIIRHNSGASNEELKPLVSNSVEGARFFKGEWISNGGRKIEFTVLNINKTFAGKYGDTPLIGQMDSKDGTTAFGFISPSSKTIKGWTGYLSMNSELPHKTLRTSWLEHSFNPDCKDPRKMLHFGVDDYTQMTTSETFPLPKTDTFFEKVRKFFKSLF